MTHLSVRTEDVETRKLKRAVRQAGRGDEEAASVLFDHYHPKLYRYALAKIGDPSDAEDVAAETFAVILRELGNFRWKGGGFEPWIFRIAYNLIMDSFRGVARVQPAPDPGLHWTETPIDQGPENAAVAAETSRELYEVLDQLPEDQRDVLLLRFAAGLDTNETAEVMKRRPNAVRQLQFRALKSMRERLRPEVVTS